MTTSARHSKPARFSGRALVGRLLKDHHVFGNGTAVFLVIAAVPVAWYAAVIAALN